MPGGSLHHSRIDQHLLAYLTFSLHDTEFEQWQKFIEEFPLQNKMLAKVAIANAYLSKVSVLVTQ